jgi:catalase
MSESVGDLSNRAYRHPHDGAGIPVERDEPLTIGPDGPIRLQDHLIEQVAQWKRERVPGRQGQRRLRFEATSDVSAYTKGAVFQPGMTTESVIRVLHLCRSRNAIAMWAASSGNTDGFTIDEVELHFGATARIVGSLATRLKGQKG